MFFSIYPIYTLVWGQSYSLSNPVDHDFKTQHMKAETSGGGQTVQTSAHFVSLPVFSGSHRKNPAGFSEDTLFSFTQCWSGLENGWSHFSIVVIACESGSGVCRTDFQGCTKGNRRFISQEGGLTLWGSLSWWVVKVFLQLCWRCMGHFRYAIVSVSQGVDRVCVNCCMWESFRACMWTHCMSAVQLLQKGVVCAFGEAALLIDKSQHAQFLKGRQTRGEERVKHTAVMMELVIIPLGPHLAAFIITMRPGNSIVIHSIFSFI